MRPIVAITLVATLLLSCPATDPPGLPPGPADPVANLALLDAFADRVQTEAMSAAWKSATEQAGARPKPFGIRPLLSLTDDEVDGLSRRLQDARQSQCLQAIHSLAVRMQSESDPAVARALAAIAPLRQQIPDRGSMSAGESDLAVREQRWLSQAQIARELAPLLRQLATARNQWARQRSRSAYLELMQQHRGYDPAVADGLEKEVRQALAHDPPESRPWEFEFIDPSLSARLSARFDEAHCLERASSVFQFIGLPAISPALQIREANDAAFSPFAFYAIDPPAVQGVTVRPGHGIAPHWSTFHEYGHAAMSLLVVPATCRTLRRPVSPAVSEGCAKIAERLFYSEEWLRSQGVPPAEIESLRQWERQSERMRVRSILADLELERVLYRNPRGDVMKHYIAIQRRTAGVQSDGELPAWALKRDLAFEPLARMDYLLARCAQAAVYRRLRALPGGLLGQPARQLLRDEIFRGATSLRFEEWFRKAAGTAPNCAAWLQDVAAAE